MRLTDVRTAAERAVLASHEVAIPHAVHHVDCYAREDDRGEVLVLAFTRSVVIGRAVADVFAFIADSRNAPQWYSAVQRAELLSPVPDVLGARYRFTRSLPSGVAVNLVETTVYVPGERVTLTSIEGPTPFVYRYTVAPAGDLATTVTLEGEISTTGLPRPFASLGPLAEQLFARGMAKNLEALRDTLERGGER